MQKLRDNISVKDIECNCGCGFNSVSPAVLDVVQDARDHFNSPAHINSRNHSACRCIEHNADPKVGGSVTSKHLPDGITNVCRAIDFEIEGITSKVLYNYLDGKYPNCLGLGLYNTFVHVDDRMTKAFRWNKSTKDK